MSYNRGDIVILPFPFVTIQGVRQKARPALIVSDHTITRRYTDYIMVGITSRVPETLVESEYLISEEASGFAQTGLAKTSVLRCEYMMTLPEDIIARKIGSFSAPAMAAINQKLKQSLGLDPVSTKHNPPSNQSNV